MVDPALFGHRPDRKARGRLLTGAPFGLAVGGDDRLHLQSEREKEKGPSPVWNQSGDGPFENRPGGGRRTNVADKPAGFNPALGMFRGGYGAAIP